MPTDASFRFSTYLTLALTCATLGYAESEMLPEVAVFAALSVVALGVLYFLESRVTFLSVPAANRLGMAVGIVYLAWAAYRIKRELDTAEFINMGWHMLIVALCGPLVMLVVVAKVARSDKHAGDYWAMHGMALAGVALAAAFAEQPLCFALVGLYLVAAVWSVTLLHLGRARGSIPPVPGGKQPATRAVAVSADPTGHRTDFRPALAWSAVAVLGAVPLYLLTPRSEASKADFGKPRIEIGYAADQMVDLNRVGPLKPNGETAFEVTAAYPDGSPKTDLDPNQLWRGRAYRAYSGGEWRLGDVPSLSITPQVRRADPWTPPHLGPGQFALTFDLPAALRGDIFADPLQWAGDQPAPLAALTAAGPQGWMPVGDGTFYWEPRRGSAQRVSRRYVQAYRAGPDPAAGPPFRFARPGFDTDLRPLRQNPVPRVKEYAERVLKDLIAAGALPAAWRDDRQFRDDRTLLPRPEYHDAIARALAAHLATTPELVYTTDLRRENKAIDPIQEFLFDTKAGHCERFAGALALMLRSQGIPAVYVLGFKGCEDAGDGRYVVRQEHAHAWVEALVPVPGPPPRDPLDRAYHWLVLDPTPGGDLGAGETDRGWLAQANSWVEDRFHEYVTNYTPEQRARALSAVAAGLARPATLAWAVGVVGLALGVRFVRRRRAARRDRPPPDAGPTRWFGALLALLAAHGLAPAPGETALEFATRAAAGLRARPGCADAAEVPLAWATAYYQSRFGGATLSADRLAELDAGLAALRRALTP
jgi:transglutaminase-like putative cysteine protease